MGRTGRLFAIEHSGVEPDILIMGKALGAYCPLTATVFSEKVSRSFDDHLFGHGQSYSGHALGCAGALAALEVLLEDGVLEAVDEKGSYLEERLQNLAAKHPCVGDVRGLGLFYTMELVADPQTRQPLRKSTEKYSPTVIAEVSRFLFEERNIYVPSDKFGVWVVPPLVVAHSEIDWITEAIDEALLRVDQQLGL